MKNMLLLSLIVLVVMSCKNRTDMEGDYDVVFNIDYDENENFDFCSFLELDTIYPLNLPDSLVIGIAQKCLLENNRIYFHDYQQHIIFVFNENGKLIYSINKLGAGPEEYDRIMDIQTTWDNRELIVNTGNKLLFYDVNDGSFTHSIKIKGDKETLFAVTCFNPEKDVFYFWDPDYKYALTKIVNDSIIGIRERKGKQVSGLKFRKNSSNDIILLPEYGECNIEYLNKKDKYYINFGKYTLPANLAPKDTKELYRIEKKNPYFKFISDVIETNNVFFITTVGPKSSYYYILIDKDSKKIRKGYLEKGEDRLIPFGVKNEYIYAMFYPEYSSPKSKLGKQLKKYSISDEIPLVVKFKFKNDY